jgi:hypothetical protein
VKHGTILPQRVIDAGDGIGLRRAETHRDDEGDGGYRITRGVEPAYLGDIQDSSAVVEGR